MPDCVSLIDHLPMEVFLVMMIYVVPVEEEKNITKVTVNSPVFIDPRTLRSTSSIVEMTLIHHCVRTVEWTYSRCELQVN